MPTQKDVKFSDYVRGLPAATEADLAAGNNMPIVSASEIKKIGGENIAKESNVKTNDYRLNIIFDLSVTRYKIVDRNGNESTVQENYGCTDFVSVDHCYGFTIYGACSMPNTPVDAAVFYDENFEKIGCYVNEKTRTTDSFVIDSSLIENFSQAKYVRFNVHKFTSRIYFLQSNKNIFDSISEIEKARKDIICIDDIFTEKGFLNKNGTVSSSDDYKSTPYLKVNDFKNLTFASLYGHFSYNIVPVQFFSKELLYLGCVEASVSNETLHVKISDDILNRFSGAYYFRCCARKTYDARVIERISESTDILKISMPKRVFAPIGENVQIFKNSIFYSNVKNNLLLSYGYYGENIGDYYGEFWQYRATTAKQVKLKFCLKNALNKVVSSSEMVEVVSFSKKSNPSSMKNLLVFGDSFTANNYYPQELKRRLTGIGISNYVDSSENAPASDNMTNINFLQEGTVGWDYDNYLTSSSPFYNPSTSKIDFSYYCQKKGIDKLDFVVIILGTNRQCENDVIKQVWNALVVHNPEVKVIVGGRILFSPYKVVFKNDIFDYNRRVESLAGSSEYSNNFCYVDILAGFDIDNNMTTILVNANNRNSNIKRTISTDYTHPSKFGYWQIADTIYNAIHYWFL